MSYVWHDFGEVNIFQRIIIPDFACNTHAHQEYTLPVVFVHKHTSFLQDSLNVYKCYDWSLVFHLARNCYVLAISGNIRSWRINYILFGMILLRIEMKTFIVATHILRQVLQLLLSIYVIIILEIILLLCFFLCFWFRFLLFTWILRSTLNVPHNLIFGFLLNWLQLK